MNTIPLFNLGLAFIPVFILLAIMLRWQQNIKSELIAIARMLGQLAFIGYALNWIFELHSPPLILAILAFMLIIACSIALRPLAEKQARHYAYALIAMILGGVTTLAFISSLVLEAEPWYAPDKIIPLAGMIFAASMNAISLAAERFVMELKHSDTPEQARIQAFRAGLIPLFNALLAVGLVSLPGMMTGQILSGVEPLIAARYQIVVMCMLTGAAGISAALYLEFSYRDAIKNQRRL